MISRVSLRIGDEPYPNTFDIHLHVSFCTVFILQYCTQFLHLLKTLAAAVCTWFQN